MRQTPLTKHQNIVDNDQRTLGEPPYHVSSKEHDAISRQVADMPRDDAIKPTTSRWAMPIVLVAKQMAPYGSA